ncbi:hypothetical protein D3C77_275340 [compost metagenome]
MKTKFSGHFPTALTNVDQFWKNCLFVLDANVLLSLYRYSNSTREEFFSVLNSLRDRLWIPYQVGQEYLGNRLSVIGEQVKAYEDSAKKVEALRSSLEATTQHPFVSSQVLVECQGTFTKLLAEFKSSKEEHERRINLDDIMIELSDLLDNKVGEPFDRARLEKAIQDGGSRYVDKIPPGFSDAKKGGDSPVFEDKCRPYGDYIIWLQIIEKASAENKPILFVTGDSKEDWWVVFNGKTTGPHPKLLQEFEVLTGNNVYLYTPHQFLQRASEFLHRETSAQAVNEIRDGELREASFEFDEEQVRTVEPESEFVFHEFFGSEYLPWNFPASDFDTVITQRHWLKEKLRDVRDAIEQALLKLARLDDELRKAPPSPQKYARMQKEKSEAKREVSYYRAAQSHIQAMLVECDERIRSVL